MKSKIALFTMLVIILNSVFVYADDDTVSISDDVLTDLQEEFEYNSETDTYYVPTSVANAKSGAVAVSGACISALLTLAVKAGLEFPGSNSMGEFLNRLFMIDGITALISEVEKVVSSSVGGVLKFNRSLLDSIKSIYSQIMTSGDFGTIYYRGHKYIYQCSSTVNEAQRRYIIENSKPLVTYTYEQIAKSKPSSRLVHTTNLPYISETGVVQIQVCKDSDGWLNSYAYDTNSTSYTNYSSRGGGYLTSGYTYSYYAYVRAEKPGYIPSLEIIVARYSTSTGFYKDSFKITPYKTLAKSYLGKTLDLPLIGEAWSDTIKGDDDSTEGNLSIKVPSNTNSLVGLTPGGVTVPDYDVWTPGVVVVPPAIDTGSDDNVYVPPYEIVKPPITDTDKPPGTDTDNPPGTDTNTPSTTWDWLKKLIQTIIDLIKNIIDWLNNFWTHLWEFLKSLLVPGETYFVDEFGKVTEKMKEKIPGIDITKLEDLAVGEFKFEDMYAKFFGVECLVVRGSVINKVISWARPIIQGLIALFLLLYNYNQIYFLIRGGSLLGASNTIDNMNNNRIGGRK